MVLRNKSLRTPPCITACSQYLLARTRFCSSGAIWYVGIVTLCPRELTSCQEQAFSSVMHDVANGDTSLLAEMHATTSGLKVLVTTACTRDIETARRALGGHGYSGFAGLGRIYADYLPAAT